MALQQQSDKRKQNKLWSSLEAVFGQIFRAGVAVASSRPVPAARSSGSAACDAEKMVCTQKCKSGCNVLDSIMWALRARVRPLLSWKDVRRRREWCGCARAAALRASEVLPAGGRV